MEQVHLQATAMCGSPEHFPQQGGFEWNAAPGPYLFDAPAFGPNDLEIEDMIDTFLQQTAIQASTAQLPPPAAGTVAGGTSDALQYPMSFWPNYQASDMLSPVVMSPPITVQRPQRSSTCATGNERLRSSDYNFARVSSRERASTNHGGYGKRPDLWLDSLNGGLGSVSATHVPAVAGMIQEMPDNLSWDLPNTAPFSRIDPDNCPPESLVLTEAAVAEAPSRKRRKMAAKTLECTHCSKQYTRTCDLNKHVRNTQKPGTHVCADCKKAFHGRKDLNRHVGSVHPGTITKVLDNVVNRGAVVCSVADESSLPLVNPNPRLFPKSKMFHVDTRHLQDCRAALGRQLSQLANMAAGPQGDMMLAHIIGKLYAAEETLRNVEDQLTTGRSRAATDPLMAWKVKHGRIAVLAALYCTRFIRRTRDGQRVRQGTQGQNDIGNYADWSAMSESNIAARA